MTEAPGDMMDTLAKPHRLTLKGLLVCDLMERRDAAKAAAKAADNEKDRAGYLALADYLETCLDIAFGRKIACSPSKSSSP
jgi:hypothetical protein